MLPKELISLSEQTTVSRLRSDLQLRGPEDLEGTLQSGIPFDLKIANLAKDGQLMNMSGPLPKNILAKTLHWKWSITQFSGRN